MMKIRSKETGEIEDVSDEAARELIDAGIFDAVDNKRPPKEPVKKPAEKPTKVEPLTTDDMPSPMKKPK